MDGLLYFLLNVGVFQNAGGTPTIPIFDRVFIENNELVGELEGSKKSYN